MTDKPPRAKTGAATYEVGNCKPPKHTQFKVGNNANPGGKTSAQRKMEIANAEKATLIRGRLLDAVIDASEAGGARTMELIEAAMLKLLADSENRGLGTPKQTVDNTSSDGSMTPINKIELVAKPIIDIPGDDNTSD
jgi:hypothetical protein